MTAWERITSVIISFLLSENHREHIALSYILANPLMRYLNKPKISILGL